MGEKELYRIMLSKMEQMKTKIDACIYELNQINNELSQAILVNDNTFYTSLVNDNKNVLLSNKNCILYDIIPEIRKEIQS